MVQSSRLKVLLVVGNFYQAIGILARYLVEACEGIDFYYFNHKKLSSRTAEFLELTRHVDVVHFLGNLSHVSSPQEFSLTDIDVPTVATIHHIAPREDYKIVDASKADVIQVIASEWVGYVRARTQTPVILAHQAIPTSRFKKNQQVNRPRRPVRIGYFGFNSSFNDRKRLDVLLEALTILKGRNIEFELVVQGPNWGRLISVFLQRGIKVRNLGYTNADKIWGSFRAIDIYTCTSDIEGGPLTALEALASGVPVISTPVGVSLDALTHGAGILVEKNNPQAFCDALTDVITNEDLYHRLVSECGEVVSAFTGSPVTQEYLSMYTRAIEIHHGNNNLARAGLNNYPLSPQRQRTREEALSYIYEFEDHQAHQFDDYLNILRALLNKDLPLRIKTHLLVRAAKSLRTNWVIK